LGKKDNHKYQKTTRNFKLFFGNMKIEELCENFQ